MNHEEWLAKEKVRKESQERWPWGYPIWKDYHAAVVGRWERATVEEKEWYRKTARLILGIDEE